MKAFIRSSITTFLFSLSLAPAIAQSLDSPAYCPLTTTDTDGDGWGTENGQPCRVLRNINAYPVCSSTTLTTDSDFDGWGWSTEGTCLVDNTSVENNFTITDSNGTLTTGQLVKPLIGRYVKSLGYFSSAVVISSEGILYHYRVPNQSLAATDIDGSTLWELRLYNDFIGQLLLDEAEETLYAFTGPDGRVAAYSTDGVPIWRSEKIGNIRSIELSQNAIIVGVGPDSSENRERMKTVLSLNLDGTTRWKFEPGGFIDRLDIGRDNRIYVKYISDPYGNETTFVLEE